MVYLEQVLPPYFAAPAGCSLKQRYPYHPIYHIIIIKDGKGKAYFVSTSQQITQQCKPNKFILECLPRTNPRRTSKDAYIRNSCIIYNSGIWSKSLHSQYRVKGSDISTIARRDWTENWATAYKDTTKVIRRPEKNNPQKTLLGKKYNRKSG